MYELNKLKKCLLNSWIAIGHNYCTDEDTQIKFLLSSYKISSEQRKSISKRSYNLLEETVRIRKKGSLIDSLIKRYPLKTAEGVSLMCLAEALLRIPDKKTAKMLLKEKISNTFWSLGLVNNEFKLHSTNIVIYGLKLSNTILKIKKNGLLGSIQGLLTKGYEPIIYQVTLQIMQKLAEKFVAGINIEDALKNSKRNSLYSYSFDMLGEAALTQKDANDYFNAYSYAIKKIKEFGMDKDNTSISIPGVSIKLSALHPRYDILKKSRILEELFPKVLKLAILAKEANTNLTIDAEESDRLVISLTIFKLLSASNDLDGWNGLGLAIQAYQKRAFSVINWLSFVAKETNRCIPIRLVKGAYWDSEIKHTQELGLKDYPVFTRKINTDISYLACAKLLIGYGNLFFPQFATHNIQTIATILEWLPSISSKEIKPTFEFQMLHGMGHIIYDYLVKNKNLPCRIYAPVGLHNDLLPYLVRRLLENGANSSFVSHLSELNSANTKSILSFPDEEVQKLKNKRHPRIPMPKNLYGEERENSTGINLRDIKDLSTLIKGMNKFKNKIWSGHPITTSNIAFNPVKQDVFNPASVDKRLGSFTLANKDIAISAFNDAQCFFSTWRSTSVGIRSKILLAIAESFESNKYELLSLLVFESGKTLEDSISEIREAIDFCRYYSVQAEQKITMPTTLKSVTGEYNTLSFQGRGTFLCISPWNFPLAIFTGQIVAALVAGNTVVAKPATNSILIATKAIQLMHLAGVPKEALHLIPGRGNDVGDILTSQPNIGGVVFTGSVEVASHINRQLAGRKKSSIVPLIAETGGQNAMIVDSTALMEQTVEDVINSSFKSAGQRCSALRIAFVQKDILSNFKEMLCGAIDELSIGLPEIPSTDVGPVINNRSHNSLRKYINFLEKNSKIWIQGSIPDHLSKGLFISPTVVEVTFDTLPQEEHFGPILHVVSYQENEIKKIINSLNKLGFGLTFGIHSRIQSRIKTFSEEINAGNIYVNRNMIGAIVGSQPFGGMGLSGTGPKAGGPNYINQFMCEKTISINTTAQGGNTDLLTMD